MPGLLLLLLASSLSGLCMGDSMPDAEPTANPDPDLAVSESQQSYGFGYGTKVADAHSVATVYVHGFGTTDDKEYHPLPPPPPVYKPHPPPPPHHNYVPTYHHKYVPPPPPHYAPYSKHHLKTSGYGYGHINEYGDASHGYGYTVYPANIGYGHKAPYAKTYYPAPPPHYAQDRSGFAHGFAYGYGNIHK